MSGGGFDMSKGLDQIEEERDELDSARRS